MMKKKFDKHSKPTHDKTLHKLGIKREFPQSDKKHLQKKTSVSITLMLINEMFP
jgi:hypothetical protein